MSMVTKKNNDHHLSLGHGSKSPHRCHHNSWIHLHSLFHLLVRGQLFRTLSSDRLFMLISLTLVSALILASISFVCTNKSNGIQKRTNAGIKVEDENMNSISEVVVRTKNIHKKKKTKKVTKSKLNVSKNDVVVLEVVFLLDHALDDVQFTSSSPNTIVQNKKMSKKKKSTRNRKKKRLNSSIVLSSTAAITLGERKDSRCF